MTEKHIDTSAKCQESTFQEIAVIPQQAGGVPPPTAPVTLDAFSPFEQKIFLQFSLAALPECRKHAVVRFGPGDDVRVIDNSFKFGLLAVERLRLRVFKFEGAHRPRRASDIPPNPEAQAKAQAKEENAH